MSRISIVLHDLRGGGAEKMMVRLANQLVEDGDDIDMILITGGGENKPYLDDRVNLIELQCHRTLNAFAPLRKALKTCRPDGVLSALTHINVISAIVCFSLGWSKKLSVSERNAFSLDKKVNANAVMKAAYAVAPWIYRVLPNPVIAVSKGVADDLIATTVVRERDVVTAPNPVITKETIEAAKHEPQHPWLVDKQTKVIVSVGRLAYQKGFDMLIDVFYKVHKTVDCRFIIFGEGELRQNLQSQIDSLGLTECVSMPGYTANPLAEMNAADLFVLSSRFEGSPNAIVEAMSVGTSVVAFDCPHGAREILEISHGKSLVEYQDVDDLKEKMINTLTSNPSGKDASLMDRAKYFSSAHSAEKYRALILR